MGTQVDHLSHLAQESARFAEAIRQAPPEAPVPTCPDWNADDLLWHLAKVQYFWGTVVREGLAGDKADELTPERPGEPGRPAGVLRGCERPARAGPRGDRTRGGGLDLVAGAYGRVHPPPTGA